MEKARKGDATAFDAIVRRHQDRVQRFAIRMMGGDSARGADVAVGAFLRLWESRHVYRPQGRLQSWLLRATYRLAVDDLRRERPHLRLESVGGFVPAPERSALAAAVRDAVRALPEEQRAVIVLTMYEGLSGEAVAEILGIPIGTVASRKSHALRTLRRRLVAWEDCP